MVFSGKNGRTRQNVVLNRLDLILLFIGGIRTRVVPVLRFMLGPVLVLSDRRSPRLARVILGTRPFLFVF